MLGRSSFLYDTYPLVVDRDLAKFIGLNEAVVVQQIHYWLYLNEQSGLYRQGNETWTKPMSLEAWNKEQFQFWSPTTVKRTFKGLLDSGIVLATTFADDPRDRARSYRIDYVLLTERTGDGPRRLGEAMFKRKPPINIDRALAAAVGLDEAIILSEISYWVAYNEEKGRNFQDGYYWTYNSRPEWQKAYMPWWSTRTIERKFDALIKDGLLITGNYNKLGADRTLWYRVNYEEITLRLASLAGGGNWSNMATGQNGRMDSPEWQDGLAQNGRMDSPEWQDGTAHNGKMDSSECQDGTAQSGSMDDSNWQDGLVQNGKMDGSKMAAPIPLANTSTKTSTKTAHETDAAAQHTEVEYSPQDVQEHIKKQWGPTIDIRTIRKLLKRWGGQRIYRQVTYITRTKSPDELQAIDNPAGYLTDACAVDYHAQWLKAQSV